MGEKNVKLLRKQIRNVCQELFPQILNEELTLAIHKRLAETINTKLNAIDDKVKKELKEINDRSKDTQAYVVSRLGTPNASTLKAD